jgi:hypothetical protein
VLQDRTTPFIVAPWQGFWVELSSDSTATNITFPKTGKTGSGTTAAYMSKEIAGRSGISFEFKSQSTIDKALKLNFREYANIGFDRADAHKLKPMTDNYAVMAFQTTTNEQLQSISALPNSLSEEVVLPVQMDLVGVEGPFTLSWNGLNDIPSDLSVTLKDYETGNSVNLKVENSYTFDVSPSEIAVSKSASVLAGVDAVEISSTEKTGRFEIIVSPDQPTSSEENQQPIALKLEQNYPIPFNPVTTIRYSIAERGQVTLNVFSVIGKKVAELVQTEKAPGSYQISWNGEVQPSGIYYYRLELDGATITKKMTLIK